MINIVKGNIVDQSTEAIVNTVNCVGVMGRGIALSFKKAFPENYNDYIEACKKGEVVPGKMHVHVTGDIFERKYIINFPTKKHWKGNSNIIDIKEGLKDLVNVINHYDIKSITIPPLGCGLGGLDWEEVRPLIEDTFKELPDKTVNIIEPDGNFDKPNNQNNKFKNGKLTPGRASLLYLMGKYLSAMMDTSTTLLELHKLMYFLQESGEKLKLKYQKAVYGPYAENLRFVLDVINNIYISGFDNREENPEKEITLLEDAYLKADEFLRSHTKTREHVNRVISLIEGFETPFGMELLSTVHWVSSKEEAVTLENVINKTHLWNPRKEIFSEKHITIAWKHLKDQNWV
jgi:O-acetyl-ADP-ribose deacetylase (regulator of RNase III)